MPPELHERSRLLNRWDIHLRPENIAPAPPSLEVQTQNALNVACLGPDVMGVAGLMRLMWPAARFNGVDTCRRATIVLQEVMREVFAQFTPEQIRQIQARIDERDQVHHYLPRR